MSNVNKKETIRKFKKLRGKTQIFAFFQMTMSELNFDWQELARGSYLEMAARGKYFEINESDDKRMKGYLKLFDKYMLHDGGLLE